MASITLHRKRPQRQMKGVLAEKEKKPSVIDKHFTSIKASEGDGDYGGGIYRPTDEQLDKINQFTRSPKTADDVVCFPTLSCNDIIDRDLDRFTTECVHDFAKLPGNLSPVGKSYMVGHDYKKLPVGRIFDVGTKKIDEATFLTNEVYLPNTEENKSFIENVDFGVYWAVSVGVMLGDSDCSVCAAPFSGWGYWCQNGHEKGLTYDPNSDEKDDWGWPEPVAEGTKGAILCHRNLFAPTDFYELSQVFLGAQYYAELEKNAGGSLKGILKAASAKAPILNLGESEAKSLPFPKEREEVANARKKFAVTTDDDGNQRWIDEHKLVWLYDAEEGEVYSLGKSAEEEIDGEEQREPDGEGGGQEEPEHRTALGKGGSDGERGSEDRDGSAGSGERKGRQDESASVEEAVDKNKEEGPLMPKKVIIAAANQANLSNEIVAKALEAETAEEALDILFSGSSETINALNKRVGELEAKAELGNKFVEAKRAEAIKWYVTNKGAGENKRVNTSTFEKMLDRFGDDIDLYDEVINEQKETAQAKFPSTRRSTDPGDPHDIEKLDPVEFNPETAKRVSRIHG